MGYGKVTHLYIKVIGWKNTNGLMEVLVCFRISKYKIIEEREKTQDDSGMDLPYNRVSINLLGDPDIQNALNKSASAEDLVSPRGPSLVGLVVVAHGSLFTHHTCLTGIRVDHVCTTSESACCIYFSIVFVLFLWVLDIGRIRLISVEFTEKG